MNLQGLWNRGRTPAPIESPRVSASRRAFLRTVGGAISSSLIGCAGMRKCEIASDMPMPDLVAHLNQNIDQINAWRCVNVTMTPHGMMGLVKLSADLAVERPRNFRLRASIPTGIVADLGSNDERFWCWMRNDEEPVIVTARHERLAVAQQQLQMPFEPDWLIEALGVIPIDESEVESEKHPTDPKRVFFRRRRRAPDGTSVELVSTVDTCRGVIVDHSLSDRSGRIVALANMGEHERDGKTGIVLPHSIDLAWPQAKMGLKIRMGAIEANPESLSAKIFEMPEIANCSVQDIGGEETQQAVHKGRAKV